MWLLLIVQCGKLMSSLGGYSYQVPVPMWPLSPLSPLAALPRPNEPRPAGQQPSTHGSKWLEPQCVWEPTWNMVEYHGMGVFFLVLWSLKLIPKPWTKPLQPLPCEHLGGSSTASAATCILQWLQRWWLPGDGIRKMLQQSPINQLPSGKLKIAIENHHF